MKVYELIEIRRVLADLKNQKLPIQAAYEIVTFIDETDKSMDFFQEELNKILREYVEVDENGVFKTSPDDPNFYKVIEGKEEESADALKRLNDLEVKIPVCNLTLSDLESVQLTLTEMKALKSIIKEK